MTIYAETLNLGIQRGSGGIEIKRMLLSKFCSWICHYWRLLCYGMRTSGIMDSLAAFRADITNTDIDDFDLIHGTETSHSVFPWEAGLSDKDKKQAIVYMPTDSTSFQEMLTATGLSIEDFQDFAFIDVGAGKGRVVLLAGEYPFSSVSGIELSRSMVETARHNMLCCQGLSMRCGHMQFLHENAASFCFPAKPLVLFFYHPFLEPVMRVVMNNLSQSLKALPRKVFILYRHPVFARKYSDECISMTGMLKKTAEKPSCRRTVKNGWSIWKVQ